MRRVFVRRVLEITLNLELSFIEGADPSSDIDGYDGLVQTCLHSSNSFFSAIGLKPGSWCQFTGEDKVHKFVLFVPHYIKSRF